MRWWPPRNYDQAALYEELGICCQVAFHSQVARESGDFTIYEVIEGIDQADPRHPHVFRRRARHG